MLRELARPFNMKLDLGIIIVDIKNGKGLQVLLLLGDDLQVQETCKTLLDNLVPESERGFNLERFDGRSAPWDQIEASLNTPPFFPGKKVVWIENVPYFISREQKGELGEKVLQAWSEGKRDDAVRLLLDLLAVEGWTQEQWELAQSANSLGPLTDLLEADGTEAREMGERRDGISFCNGSGQIKNPTFAVIGKNHFYILSPNRRVVADIKQELF